MLYWTVSDAKGKHQARCRQPEAAAILASFYGPGATVRNTAGEIFWTEGSETIRASRDVDLAAKIIRLRLHEMVAAMTDATLANAASALKPGNKGDAK